jgi:hypothetical protein
MPERFRGDGQLGRLIFEGTLDRAAEGPTFDGMEDPDLIVPGWKLWIPAQVS